MGIGPSAFGGKDGIQPRNQRRMLLHEPCPHDVECIGLMYILVKCDNPHVFPEFGEREIRIPDGPGIDRALCERHRRIGGRERLKAIRETTDGFEIARRDLELRGPGELLGTRQTGLAQLRVAELMRDADLLPRVHDAAELLMKSYPEHIDPLAMRWIGSAERYGRVG